MIIDLFNGTSHIVASELPGSSHSLRTELAGARPSSTNRRQISSASLCASCGGTKTPFTPPPPEGQVEHRRDRPVLPIIQEGHGCEKTSEHRTLRQYEGKDPLDHPSFVPGHQVVRAMPEYFADDPPPGQRMVAGGLWVTQHIMIPHGFVMGILQEYDVHCVLITAQCRGRGGISSQLMRAPIARCHHRLNGSLQFLAHCRPGMPLLDSLQSIHTEPQGFFGMR